MDAGLLLLLIVIWFICIIYCLDVWQDTMLIYSAAIYWQTFVNGE